MLCGGHHADAEDLVQIAFRALWERWHLMREHTIERSRAFLWSVVANQAVSRWRTQQRETVTDPQSAHAVFDRPWPLDVTHAVLAKGLLDDCWAVIQTMPPARRFVIILQANGYRTREIAALMGIAQATVRGHRAAAVRQITDKVGPVITILNDIGDHDRTEPA